MKFKIFALIGILGLLCGGMLCAATGNSIDLSEELLKVRMPYVFHQLGDTGFAVYDFGANELKFFNWQFKVIQTMPLLFGEAPGEVKTRIQSVCVIEQNIYIIGMFEQQLKIYNKSGSYIKSIPLGIMPIYMMAYQDKLYIFNMRFAAKMTDPVLCKVFSTKLGKFEKDILLKENLHLEKVYEGDIEMIGRSSRFDLSADTIYLQNGEAGVLIEIKMNGKVVRRTNLPYPARTEIKLRTEERKVINNLDTYLCLKLLDNNIYTAFSKNIGTDKKEGYRIYKTHVIKIPPKGEFTEKILAGQYVFIGDHQGILYLFNMDDYTTASIKLAGW